jgi:small-conductance mechanosensitive channel
MDIDIGQIKQVLDTQINDLIWWTIGIGLALFFKNAIENWIWGLMFIFDRDYSVDDEVLIGGVRKARIVRQTITKTVFYMYDNNTRLVVPNKEFGSLRCEKILSGTKINPQA